MARLRVDHETVYTYSDPVLCSNHLAHLQPRDTGRQHWLSHRLTIEPEPTSVQDRVDIYGNRAIAFSVEREYKVFRVVTEGVVDVADPAEVADDCPWEAVASAVPRHLELSMFAFASPYASFDETIRSYARQSFSADRSVFAACSELMTRIYTDFRYAPGTTRIGDQPPELLRRRQGVCQDFAHVMIACLRSIGLPCRYVSGYLRTYPPPGQAKLVGCDATHAWVAAWCGPQDGWVEFDPTNNRLAGADHVVLAWGRDFGDVSPLKGVVTGGGYSTLRVAVNVDLDTVKEKS